MRHEKAVRFPADTAAAVVFALACAGRVDPACAGVLLRVCGAEAGVFFPRTMIFLPSGF